VSGISGASTLPPPNESKHLSAPILDPVPGIEPTDEPTFNWSEVPGATSYEILLRNVTPGIRPGSSYQFTHETVTGDTSFTFPFTLNPTQKYQVKVRADDGSRHSAWSNVDTFTIAEQKTTDFRIRLDKSFEVDVNLGLAKFEFTVQAVTDSQGRTAMGPPRFVTFEGAGTGVDVKVKFGAAGKSNWENLTTPIPMLLDDFNSAGGITALPGISLGPGIGFGLNLGFVNAGVFNFTDHFTGTSHAIGVTALAQYGGFWSVGAIDKSMLTEGLSWPNY
jgi:hypothetical protein